MPASDQVDTLDSNPIQEAYGSPCERILIEVAKREWTLGHWVRQMRVDRHITLGLLRGHPEIKGHLARELARVLGGTPQEWIDLDRSYRLTAHRLDVQRYLTI